MLAGLTLGLFIGACCTGHYQGPEVSFRQPVNEAWRSAVKLQVRNIANSEAAIASGFPIDKERIMTAGHFCVNVIRGQIIGLLKDDVEIAFVNNNGEVSLLTGGEIETVDEKKDICVVKRPKHGIVPLKLAKYSEVKIHDKVEVVGSPMGMFPVSTEGRIAVLKSEGWPMVDMNDRIIISASAAGGNSGGPIILENGEVVGIVMAVLVGYPHIVLGVHVDTILDYLEQEYGK